MDELIPFEIRYKSIFPIKNILYNKLYYCEKHLGPIYENSTGTVIEVYLGNVINNYKITLLIRFL